MLQGTLPVHSGSVWLPQIAAHLNDVLWICEPHSGRFLYVSPAYDKAGWGRSEALYLDASQWLSSVHDDDRPQLSAALLAMRQGEGYALEYRRALPDGAAAWVTERAWPVKGSGPGGPRFAGVSQDITHQRLEQLNQRRAAQARDDAMAVAAHELRGLMQPLLSAAALLTRRCDAGEESTAALIQRQVQYMARMVDDLLDASRVTLGKLRLHRADLPLAEVLTSAIAANQSLVDARRLHVSVAGVHRAVWVHGDAMRLIQVFRNLIHNAAKFSDEGGSISVGVRPGPARGEVTVAVRDQGRGMTPEETSSVFDLYVQRVHAGDAEHGGLGIGLSVVRSLVDLHGGRVSAHSDGLGRGCTFEVTLPATGLTTSIGHAAPLAITPKARKLSVLLVDDSCDAAQTLCAVLESEGHAVVLAFTGEAALVAATQMRPDVAILDLDLPDIDGCDVARRLRQNPAGGPMRLFALTGSDGEEARRRINASGFDMHFVKPTSPSALIQALQA